MHPFIKAIFFAFVILGSLQASAHPLDLGYFNIEEDSANSAFRARLELNPNAVENFSKLPLHSLNRSSANLKTEDIFNSTLAKVLFTVGDHSCTWSNPTVKWMNDTQLSVEATANCKKIEPTVKFQFNFLDRAPSTFQILGKLVLANETQSERSFLIDKKSLSFEAKRSDLSDPHFLQFAHMGVEHIGATPSEWKNDEGYHFPDGIDHILFIFALILGGGTFLGLVKTATGFTIGHSITLALASLGIVHLPSRWVESAIALSIVFVACEAIFSKESKNRWKVAMGFGLVHGFGFASALEELHLSRNRMLEALVGFNLGVEAGQILIIALVAPLIFWIMKQPRYSVWTVRILATGVALIGSYWFVVRAFQLG